jgi:hypothetical protein
MCLGRDSRNVCIAFLISTAMVFVLRYTLLASAQTDINGSNKEIQISEQKPTHPGFYTDESGVKMNVRIKNNLPTAANLSVSANNLTYT